MSIDLGKFQTSKKPGNSISLDNVIKFLNKDISLAGNGLPIKTKERFFTELETLTKAGLNLKPALELIIENHKKKEKKLFQNLKEDVIAGSSLSEAMSKSGKFSEYEIFCIRIAEESGKMAPVLKDLADHFSKQLQFRRLLISALSYPVLVIFVAFASIAFLLNFLVPLFGDIYNRLHSDLPPITQVVVKISALFNVWFSPSILLAGLIAVGLYFFRKRPWLRKLKAGILGHLPIFGKLFKDIYLARFCQTMGFMLQSRIPILTAMPLVERIIGFYPIEVAIQNARLSIVKGKPLFESLGKFKVFPHSLITLIKIGEEANQLPGMFLKLADQYNQEVEQRTKLLGSLIEPVLIIFLAAVVGFVLIAMYLPIFKLVTNFNI